MVQRAIIAKFDDCLTSEVAESSKHSDHIRASENMIEKLVAVPSPVTLSIFVFVLFFYFILLLLFLIPTKLGLPFLQMVSLVFSDNTAARSHSLCMDEKVAGLVADVKKWKDAEKVAAEEA